MVERHAGVVSVRWTESHPIRQELSTDMQLAPAHDGRFGEPGRPAREDEDPHVMKSRSVP